MSSLASRTTPDRLRSALPASVVVASVVSILLSAAVSAIAHGAGAPRDFQALMIGTYSAFIVIGLLAGAIAWNVIRRRSANPRRLLARLVPTVVVVSLIPDIAVGAGKSLPHTTWSGIVALMVMHLIVAAVGVASFRYFLPLDA